MTLLTCFGPFGPWPTNSTELVTAEVARRLGADRLVLPTSLGRAPERLEEALLRRPTAVVATGLAGKRPEISVERVAVNVADFRIDDIDGARPCGDPLAVGEPDAWMSTVDLHALVAAIEAAGPAARISNTAGTFVCNAVYFHLLRWARRSSVPAVFLHLPPLPGAAAAIDDSEAADPDAEMPFDLQVAGVEAAVRFVAP